MKNLTIDNFDDADEFREYFERYGRGDNFTRSQFETLFNYLTEVSPDERLDVIGLCCEFTGYSSAEEAANDLGYDSISDLEDNCYIITTPSGEVLVQH